MNDCLKMKGVFHFKQIRDGIVIAEFDVPNTIVTQGKNHALATQFTGGTALSAWKVGLISSASYSAVAAADTYDSHAGWTEFTGYSGGARPAWVPGTPASGTLGTDTAASFTINAAGTVKGLFLCAGTNAGTPGDSTASGNFLWCATLFTGGDRVVADADTLQVSYSVTF